RERIRTLADPGLLRHLVHPEIQRAIWPNKNFRAIFQANRFTTKLPAIEPGTIGRAQVANVEAIWFGGDFQMMARDAGIVNLHGRYACVGSHRAPSNNDAWSIDLIAQSSGRPCAH